jgi:hypothetical protein
MRGIPMRISVLLIALIACAPLSRAGWFDILFHHDVQVVVTTDMTPAGVLLPAPSKDNPVYYIGVSMGYRDLGGYIAGDKLPAQEAMYRWIAKALAKQGYLPATDQHPPTQLVVFTWGSLYARRIPVSGDPNWPEVQTNRIQMLRFLGGEKLGLISKYPMVPEIESPLGLMYLRPDAERTWNAATDDLYMTILLGYDFEAAVRKERRLLWRTRIACPSRGLVMADTLPTMLSIATPHIARDTAVPVWIRASDRYKPVVKIGDPVVDEYLDSGPLPIIDGNKNRLDVSKKPKTR